MEAALEARRLRGERIPQLVGMSVAARMLAAELARLLLEDAQRMTDAQQMAADLGLDDALAAEVAPLLAKVHIGLAENVSRLCAERAEGWLAAAYQAEGRAGALEESSAGR
jgi:streptomycin 6-kinase